MFGMWDAEDVGRWGCGMLRMWDVWDVGCSGCGMSRMWDVRDVGCLVCGMFAGMWDVDLQNVGQLFHQLVKEMILGSRTEEMPIAR